MPKLLTLLPNRPARQLRARRRRHLCEPLERRLMMYQTYVGQGDGNAVWGSPDLGFNSYTLAVGNIPFKDRERAIIESMGVWAGVTPLTFTERSNAEIKFETGAFTGEAGWDAKGERPGSSPGNGHVIVRPLAPGQTYYYEGLVKNLTHAVGHSLGLAHANGELGDFGQAPPSTPAVMDVRNGQSNYFDGQDVYLRRDDIYGIGSLYGGGLGYVLSTDGDGTQHGLHVFGTGSADLITLNVNVQAGTVTATSQYLGGDTSPVSFTRSVSGITSMHLHGLGSGDTLRVEKTGAIPVFVDGGAGDDTCDVQYTGRNFDNVAGEISFDGGPGADSAFLYDDNNPDADAYVVVDGTVQRPSSFGTAFKFDGNVGRDLAAGDLVENVTLRTGTAANTVGVLSTPSGQKTFLNSSAGADTVNLGNRGSLFNPGHGLDDVDGEVRIENTPSHTTVNIDDFGATRPFFGGNGGSIDSDGVFGSYAGGGFLASNPQISWRHADVSVINLTASLQVDFTRVLRSANPLTINIPDSEDGDYIVLGAAANGLQSITAPITITATAGGRFDLAFDDTGDAAARTGAVSVAADGYTQVTGLAPATVRYKGTRTLFYRTGAANDRLTFTDVANPDNADLVLSDRGGTDDIHFSDRNTAAADFTGYQFHTEGVDLYMRQQSFGDQYLARRVRYDSSTGFTPDNLTVSMSNLASAPVPSATVIGTPSGFLGQTTIYAGSRANRIVVAPRDANGNSTLNTPLGIFGEGGADEVVVDETSQVNGRAYTVLYPPGSGTAHVRGLGVSVLGVFGDVEAISLLGGAGDDTLKFESFQTGGAFRFAGGPGNDTVEVTPTSRDLSASVTNLTSFAFDGGTGTLDTFKLFNQSNPNAWTYTRQGATLAATRSGSPAYSRSFALTNLDQTDVNAGNAGDQFIVRDAAPGSIHFLSGGGGADNFLIGGPAPAGAGAPGVKVVAAGDVLDGIQGVVGVLGDAADSVVLEDSGDATGDTVHLDASYVGNFPGDNLFGPGGRLYYAGVATLTLNLGTGADTVYAQPSPTTYFSINANGPTTAAGDALNLAMAGVQSYSVTPTGPGSGIVSSTNRNSISYTGVDRPVQADAVAPSALSGQFLFDAPKPAVRVAFSEDVSRGLQTYAFELENLTAVQSVPFDAMHLEYDAGTNRATLTFPGLPTGILPDGRYRLTLSSSSFSDAFGNYSTSDFQFDFFALAGDFNRDGVVSVGDLGVLATNFNKIGQSFSRGDANYDGVVSVGDLGILATNFNKSLPPAPAQITASSAAKASVLTRTPRTRRLAVFR